MKRDTMGKEIKEAANDASKKKVKFRSYELDVSYLEYTEGGTCIELHLPSGEPFATATSWVPGLEKDEVAVKNYSENAGVLEALIDGEVVEPPHRAHGLNFCHLDVCRLF